MIASVCHVIPHLEMGGAENHLRILTHGQVESGLVVHIVALKRVDYDFLKTFSPSVKVTNLAGNSRLRKGLILRNLIICNKIDVVHAHLPLAEIYSSLALWRCGSVKIVTRHITGNFKPRWSRNVLLPISKFVFRSTDHVIAISKAVKKSLLDIEKISEDKVCIIPYGYKPSIEQRKDAKQNLGKDFTFRIVSVMRLEEQKRPMDLLEAFAIFKNKIPASELHIFGDGSQRDRCERWITEHGMAQIFLHGKVTDAASKLKDFDLFVLTSAYEGFGLVYLEAIAAGLPIVSTDNAAALEILEGCEVLFATIANPESIANQMLNAFKNYEIIVNLASLKNQIVLEKYSPEKMVASTDSLYKKLVCEISRV